VKRWVAAGAAVLAAFLALGLLADAFAPAPTGPRDSSYATTPVGVAAWAELLARAGHPVGQLRSSLADARLDRQATLVIVGADGLNNAEAGALDRFAGAGGRLVLAGGSLDQTLPKLLADPPEWTPAGPRTFHPAVSVPEVAGVGTVISAGEGAFTGRGLIDVRRLGRGRLDLLADPSPLQNRLLAAADNAQLALNLAGGARRPVVFAEALHGFGAATGLAALPGRWWLTLAGLALAGAAWALGRGRRLGPPERPPAPAPPPRSAYVDALAGVLIRTGDTAGIEKLASEARR